MKSIFFLLVVVSQLSADVYWLRPNSGIFSANDDGSNGRQVLDLDAAFGVQGVTLTNLVTAGDKLFWGDVFGREIFSCNLDGSAPTRILDQTSVSDGLVVDGEFLYFFQGGSLVRCRHDGSDLAPLINPYQILIDSGEMPSGVFAARVREIILLDDTLYFADEVQGGIFQINLDGTQGERLISMDTDFSPEGWVIRSLATDGQFLYWSAYSSESVGGVYRSNLDGTAPSFFFSQSSLFRTERMSTNGERLFFADIRSGESNVWSLGIAHKDIVDFDSVLEDVVSGPRGVAFVPNEAIEGLEIQTTARLRFETREDMNYSIRAVNGDGSFVQIGLIEGDGLVKTFCDDRPPLPSQLYRVVEVER